MNIWSQTRGGLVLLPLMVALAGCSGNGKSSDSSGPSAEAPKAPPPPAPVTLKFAYSGGSFNPEAVKKVFTDPLAKKFPHITLELIDFSVKGNELATMIAARTIPDIYVNFDTNMSPFAAAGLLRDIEPQIKEAKVNLDKITPEFLNGVKNTLGIKYLPGLPIKNNAFGLIYNKDLFDKFGVAYPKDNMTWQEVKAIGDRLSRTDGGTQYIGLHPAPVYNGGTQLSLPWIDVVNDKGVFQSAEWKGVFELWVDLYKLSSGGYIPKGLNMTNTFYEGKLGMMAGYSLLVPRLIGTANLNWDVVTYPTNSKAPGVGQAPDAFFGVVSSTSKYPLEAVQALSTFLQDDVQLELSRNGEMSVLKDRGIQDQFGKGNPALTGKNMVAFTKLKLGSNQNFKFAMSKSPLSVATTHFDTIVNDGLDINTALRNADEEMGRLIAEAKNK